MFWHVSVLLSVHGGGGGGYPYPIMLCNITQDSMGQTPGGVPCQVQLEGTLPGGYPAGGYPGRVPPGQVRTGGYPGRVPPGQVRTGVPCWGGIQVGYPLARSGRGYPAGGGYPVRTTEGVLTTRRAVCLLRSRGRTFLSLLLWLW